RDRNVTGGSDVCSSDLYPNVRRHLIFAAFKDKDIPAILSEVEGAFTSITLTTFHHPRVAKTSELIHFMKKGHYQIITDWKEALRSEERRVGKEWRTGG